MRANQSEHNLHQTYSLDVKSNNAKDKDSISVGNLNMEQSVNLHYLAPPNSKTLPHRRRSLTKRSTNIDTNGNGLTINGAFFDREIFEPLKSSYVLDYNDTPKDLNRFIETYNMKSKNATYLDPNLFKISFVLTLSEWHVDKELLLDYYPKEADKTHMMEEISYYKKFCFPEMNSKEKNKGTLINETSTYIFTRTAANGQAEYGYCRRITYDKQITKFPVVICIVSTYSYFKLYDAILNELTTTYISSEYEFSLLMQSFYSKPMPNPTLNSSDIVCKLNNRRVFFYTCPHDERLNHDYFSTLLSSLSPDNIVHLFESMLRSKKILCFSNSLTKLTKCCLALSFLIYPFMWTFPFVSIMPSSWMQDLLDSPCPYIYGCLYETAQQTPTTMENDSVRVDLDLNTIDIGLNDGFIIPLDLRQTLNSSLEYLIRFRLSKSNLNLINILVSEACLHVFTELFHRLPDFFKRDQIPLKTIDHQRNDSGIDVQSVASNSIENRLGYDFRSDEFLILQPTPPYVTFLNDFIHGMTFLKFLDDYQRNDNNFSLFTQRLNERRRMTMDELSINPVIRFRQTFDLLEKQIKQSPKITNPIISKIMKKLF